MILSMTGYGKAENNFNNKNISVEIRALNSKNSDIKIRIPNIYKEKELTIRKLLQHWLKRGKIDITINVEDLANRPSNQINLPVLNAYMNQLKHAYPDTDPTQLLVATLRLPDVLQPEKEELDETEWQNLKNTLHQAAEQLTQYRKDEGKSLEKDLRMRIDNIRKHLHKTDDLDSNRIEKIKQRLYDALQQIKQEADPNRFEQELIYYLEKFDINEEKVRLNNHLNYFEEQLNNSEETKGKKLGFIAQEMGREINTIGSKANDSQIQKEVVKMKDELEKIKEQVLNVL